jgi:hypothetical protein
MNQIKKIAIEAQKALDKIKNGKTFPTTYVVARLEAAASKNSKDALICHMRDIMSKRASADAFVSQREIADLYDRLYGMSGGSSKFRAEVGDLLPERHASLSIDSNSASGARVPYDEKMEPLFKENALSNELAGVFSLDKKGSFSAFADNTIKKAEKFAKLQLISMGCVPQTVKAIRSNEHFVLCTASVDTSDFTQVDVPIPVQVTRGIPALPTHFVQDDKLIKLNQENLFVFIKDKDNFRKKASASKFAAQRSFSEFNVGAPVTPAALEKYTNLENELIAAASSFSTDQVKMARGVVASELAGFGIPNPQVRVAASSSGTLTFAADIPTTRGRIEVNIPVDMPNGRPVIPSNFEVGGNTYRLNEDGLKNVIAASEKDIDINKVSRDVGEMSKMTYGQLVAGIIDGVSKSDYKQAEDALEVIRGKFGDQQYLAALDKFSKLLKHSSKDSEREALVKQAFDRGDLIRVPTSVQLYCPKLGLPVSKVSFNAKGKPVPMRREAQRDNLSETGAMISSSKIALS